MFIVMTGDPFDDDCEIFGPFKTERAAQAVAAAGSSEESEWSAVAVSAPQPGASNNGTAVVCRGYAVIPGQWEPGIGGVMEPYFVGPFLDLAPGPSPMGSMPMRRSRSSASIKMIATSRNGKLIALKALRGEIVTERWTQTVVSIAGEWTIILPHRELELRPWHWITSNLLPA
jgi:hypothetical protein